MCKGTYQAEVCFMPAGGTHISDADRAVAVAGCAAQTVFAGLREQSSGVLQLTRGSGQGAAGGGDGWSGVGGASREAGGAREGDTALARNRSLPAKIKRPFPFLSSMKSFTQLWQWYVTPMPELGRSPNGLEEGRDVPWRAGHTQRWAEFHALLQLVDRKAVSMTALQGRPVDGAAAGAALDAEWVPQWGSKFNLASFYKRELKKQQQDS